MKKDFLFIILGSDENAYGMARSYYELFNRKALLLCERHLYVIKDFNKEEVFIERIVKIGENLKSDYKKLVLVPCSDNYMELCIKNKSKLTYIYENNFIDYSVLEKFITKDKFYEMCEKYKLRYPSTLVVKLNERESIINKIPYKYPIVLKPNNSNSLEYLNVKFKGKKKVYILNSKNDLIETINNINVSNYKDNLIIQEFIEGDDTSDVVINAYSNKIGKVVFMGLGKVVIEEYHPKTMGNYGAIITSTGYHPIFNSIKYFLESIHYTGFSNFDLKYDKKTNEYYIFEINYRQGRSSFFIEAGGVSLIKLMYDDLILDKVPKNTKNLTKEALWQNVPTYIIKKYVKNKSVLEKVKVLNKSKSVVHTLIYNKDISFKRILTIIKIYISKVIQFRDYFIKK